MKKLNVRKVVGLEGFVNSGKTTIMKNLCRLLLQDKSAKILYVFDYNGNELADKEVDLDDGQEILIVMEVYGKVVLIVSAGDLLWVPKYIIEIIIRIKIQIDVAFVAMRYKYPEVGSEYRKQFIEFGVGMTTVFKPGFRRCNELSKEIVVTCENLWVNRLKEELMC